MIHSYYTPLAAESNNAASVGLAQGGVVGGGWGGLRGGELAAHCDKLPSQVSDFQGFSTMVLTLEMITMSAGLRSRATLLILLAGGWGAGGDGGALNGHFQRSPFEV